MFPTKVSSSTYINSSLNNLLVPRTVSDSSNIHGKYQL